MCGIAGILSKSHDFKGEYLAKLARSMADTMSHRGPDDSGVWVAPEGDVALAHRRLSVVDTSRAGHQPMSDPSGSRTLVYNGEIYNFHDLRRGFERDGVQFASTSDTEVLLAALVRQGTGALETLDGMFAFGYYDDTEGRLLLARDLFGEKPLYYVENEHYFAFASELSALTLLPKFDTRIDGDTIARYLAYQYIPAPETIYRSVRKLPPGQALVRSNDGDTSVAPYATFQTSTQSKGNRSITEVADELESVLIDNVRRRLVSDVPIGAFLSGGVDSSLIVAIANRLSDQPVKTFTIGFEGYDESEHHDANEAAGLIGVDHRCEMVSPDAVSLGKHIGKVLDEPNADSSCLPTYLLSAFTRQHVTVALSGDGGDEMFGGYGRYLVTVDEHGERPKTNGRRPTAGEAYWSDRLLIYPPEELNRLLGGVPASVMADVRDQRAGIDDDTRPLINRLREADAANYLPGAVLAKVDRMSMQSSLEVRSPFLGRDVAELAQGLAGDHCYSGNGGKVALKEVAKRYLPPEWVNKPKRGFGLPMGPWASNTLLPAAREILLSDEGRLKEWIPYDRLRAYLDTQAREFQAYRVWSLFILETWLRHHPATVGSDLSQVEPLPADLPRAPSGVSGLVRRAWRRGRRMARLGSRLG